MRRPNILVLLTDDHAGWCMGCAGNHDVRTPNMDYLAREGVHFTAATTPCPVCSPARASFWTGTIPSWHGVHDHLNHKGHPGIGDQPTLANALQTAGYRTAQIGKWHCHTSEDNRRRHGFDRWFSHYAGTRAHFGDHCFWDQDTRVDLHGFQAPMITEAAVSFLRHAAAGDQPFLCAVGYTDTHMPFAGSPGRLVSSYDNATLADIPREDLPDCHGRLVQALRRGTPEGDEAIRHYYAETTYIDEQLGRLLDELRNLGILDETLVIYTGDHGHCTGHHGVAAKGNSTLPQNFFDESLHVPLIASLPGVITPGTRSDAPVDHTDTYRTLIDLTGAEDPDNAPRPGQSWLAQAGGEKGGGRASVFAEYGNAWMISTDSHKLIRRFDGANGRFGDELYNRHLDPREEINLIDDANPAVLRNLDDQLDGFFHQFSHPERQGRRVDRQPLHNTKEPWRVDANLGSS